MKKILKSFKFRKFFGSLVGKMEVSDSPLNRLSIVFLISFNIFILFNIIQGLDYQRKNITSTYDKYPYICSTLFESLDKNAKISEFDKIKTYEQNDLIRTKNINAPLYDEDFKNDKRSPYCKELSKKIISLKNSQRFNELYEKLKTNKTNKDNFETDKYNYEIDYRDYIEKYKAGLGNYKTRISGIDGNNIRKNYANILNSIISLESQEKTYLQEIKNLEQFKNLLSFVNKNKKELNLEKSKYNFWYPVYVTLMEMILIIPILIASILLCVFAMKRKFRIISILSSNLVLITMIFTFYIIIKITYFIIPKKFLANIFELLASMKLLAIWNYTLVIFGIILFGILMVFSQKIFDKWKRLKEEQKKEKQLLNKEKIAKERFWTQACIDCSKKLLKDSKFCSNCGCSQYKKCSKCKNDIPKIYTHCEKCGESNK